MKGKLIVWDLHGTLESGNDLVVIRISNEVLRRCQRPERFADTDATRLYGLKWYEYFRELLPNEPQALWMRLQDACFELSANDARLQASAITPAPHAIDVLRRIAPPNQQLVLSNTRPANLDVFLTHLHMTKFFPLERRIAVDGHNQAGDSTKQAALTDYLRLHPGQPVIVVGDSASDMDLAASVGALAVLYHHPHLPRKDVPADRHINDLREVLDTLKLDLALPTIG